MAVGLVLSHHGREIAVVLYLTIQSMASGCWYSRCSEALKTVDAGGRFDV